MFRDTLDQGVMKRLRGKLVKEEETEAVRCTRFEEGQEDLVGRIRVDIRKVTGKEDGPSD